MKKCIFCKSEIHFDGNNAEPLAKGVCCNYCNTRYVVPYRFALSKNRTPRVKLAYMEGEPQMPSGLEGDVVETDGIGQIHVKWDNHSSLALNAEVDTFSIF